MRCSPLTATPAVEGAFANYNPRTQILAGPDALVAGVGSILPTPGGLIMGRFGFANLDTGIVYNAQADAGGTNALVGVVIPICGSWQKVYPVTLPSARCVVRVLRSGLGVTLSRRGDFWVRFPYGAVPGARVYAATVDGTALSGNTMSSVLTPWSVIDRAAPGGLSRISTWSNFT